MCLRYVVVDELRRSCDDPGRFPVEARRARHGVSAVVVHVDLHRPLLSLPSRVTLTIPHGLGNRYMLFAAAFKGNASSSLFMTLTCNHPSCRPNEAVPRINGFSQRVQEAEPAQLGKTHYVR